MKIIITFVKNLIIYEMVIFFVLICIASAVFNIILFYKIWVMTDNVAEIKKKYFSEPRKPSIKQPILKGDIDGAANLIIDELIENVQKCASSSDLKKETRRELIDVAINNAKEKLKHLDRMGMLPTHLSDSETFAQYYNYYLKLFNASFKHP